MAVTGLKVSELSRLVLGTTGTLFYVVAPPTNSFKMYESDVYNTLNTLHISGNYQPKMEDWRFVHKTGVESITGSKTFVGGIKTDVITSSTLSTANSPIVSLGEGRLFSSVLGGLSVDWSGRKLANTSSATSLDWQNKTLSGNWVAQSLYVSGRRLLGHGEILRDSPGEQSIDYGNRLLKNVLGNTTINWDGHTLYDSDTNAVFNWDDRQIFNDVGNITVDAQNNVLSGMWAVQGLKLILTGVAPSTPTSAGISGQIAVSGQKLFIATGSNKWGYINITPW